jgi:hypothetical protein
MIRPAVVASMSQIVSSASKRFRRGGMPYKPMQSCVDPAIPSLPSLSVIIIPLFVLYSDLNFSPIVRALSSGLSGSNNTVSSSTLSIPAFVSMRPTWFFVPIHGVSTSPNLRHLVSTLRDQ